MLEALLLQDLKTKANLKFDGSEKDVMICQSVSLQESHTTQVPPFIASYQHNILDGL
jgi:hypothetical protein